MFKLVAQLEAAGIELSKFLSHHFLRLGRVFSFYHGVLHPPAKLQKNLLSNVKSMRKNLLSNVKTTTIF